jgi:hypothetical protein
MAPNAIIAQSDMTDYIVVRVITFVSGDEVI